MANQRIDGNNNVQVGHVGGDLVIGESFDPHNPNLIACPSCWKLTSRYAAPCRCGFQVAAHFAALARRERKEKLIKRAVLLSVVGLPALLGSTHIASTFGGPLMWVGLGLLALAYMHVQAADRL
ncbi:hypothetical protein GPA22_19685 [Aromatoleum toluvorans]|uniref:Uncharacterized protein n=1 Tax=Aromatoleum toluvorans TaxID=92002 RepID=A0ABX1Q2R5_9RHOO|nr:hypothetical protein [Aromatoleum toluvorans]NMG45943.1 hypothetical protein [Aromatoleum toluvorans]